MAAINSVAAARAKAIKKRARDRHGSFELPPDWDGFRLHYRYGGSKYIIDVRRGDGATTLLVDGVAQDGSVLALVDDGRPHSVELRLSQGGAASASHDDNRTEVEK